MLLLTQHITILLNTPLRGAFFLLPGRHVGAVVSALLGHQLGMISAFADLAVMYHDYVVRVADR